MYSTPQRPPPNEFSELSLLTRTLPSVVRTRHASLFGDDAYRRRYWNSPFQAILTQDGDQHRNKIGFAVPTNFDIELQPTTVTRGVKNKESGEHYRPIAFASATSITNSRNGCARGDAQLHLRQRLGFHRLPAIWETSTHSVVAHHTRAPLPLPLPLPRIVILVPWVQRSPTDLPWFDFWLESCRINAPLFEWMLFTPHSVIRPTAAPSNVHFIDITRRDPHTGTGGYGSWEELFDSKMKLKNGKRIPINSMHIKDLKPAFGEVFAEWTRNYTHFGFGDTDVVYGDLRRFVLIDELERYDIISAVSHDLPVCSLRLVCDPTYFCSLTPLSMLVCCSGFDWPVSWQSSRIMR